MGDSRRARLDALFASVDDQLTNDQQELLAREEVRAHLAAKDVFSKEALESYTYFELMALGDPPISPGVAKALTAAFPGAAQAGGGAGSSAGGAAVAAQVGQWALRQSSFEHPNWPRVMQHLPAPTNLDDVMATLLLQRSRKKIRWPCSTQQSLEKPLQAAAMRLLRKVKAIGGYAVCWHPADTSNSGLSGRQHKPDLALLFTANMRTTGQLITFVELKKPGVSKEQALGQVVGRNTQTLLQQPGRQFIISAAVGYSSVQLVLQYSNGEMYRSDEEPFSLLGVASGLKLLLRLLLASSEQLGYSPGVLPSTISIDEDTYKATFSSFCLIVDKGMDLAGAAAVQGNRVFTAELQDHTTQTKDTVAVKFGKQDVIEREAEVLRQLAAANLPNVVRLKYSGPSAEGFFVSTSPVGMPLLFDIKPQQLLQFMALHVLQRIAYKVSTDLESLMYVFTYMALKGHVHWARAELRSSDAIDKKMCAFQGMFRDYTLQRCCAIEYTDTLVSLRRLFFEPEYRTDVTVAEFKAALPVLARGKRMTTRKK
ncbi:hypothetical protein JKP88DRAFT_333308 [Tribonema minus]|uniref:Uncharacterized protein n=1 Tax=Tribonema minus TaxID=303371 RepID=A0A835YKG9_9STRA|nr:hypothetical protein JKP88DRAFT_333308 [Tribonema minus]